MKTMIAAASTARSVLVMHARIRVPSRRNQRVVGQADESLRRLPPPRGEQAEQDLRIARLFEEGFETRHFGEHGVRLAGPFSGDGDHYRRRLPIEPPHPASHLR